MRTLIRKEILSQLIRIHAVLLVGALFNNYYNTKLGQVQSYLSRSRLRLRQIQIMALSKIIQLDNYLDIETKSINNIFKSFFLFLFFSFFYIIQIINKKFYMDREQINIEFQAKQYGIDDAFEIVTYRFSGSQHHGWRIFRNGLIHLQLEKGYKVLKTVACGICSTDIDRRFLPFPLPQIIGHQLIAEPIPNQNNVRCVVQINDSDKSRGYQEVFQDSFCKAGLETHSPTRFTLGINRLPGGFGPYILAPINSIIPYINIPSHVAVLIQPFAAALQALKASLPQNGYRVGVLGPRRLGNLIIAALKAYRSLHNIKYEIHGIVRHQNLQNLCKNVGADIVHNINKENIQYLKDSFDILYDTTSTQSGFNLALQQISKLQLHLKTTNGQKMGGIPHLTELVVDQISLLSVDDERSFEFCWASQNRSNKNIYVSPSLTQKYSKLKTKYTLYSGEPADALSYLQSKQWNNQLPRFDLAIAGNPIEIGQCIRPVKDKEDSLVRPRGAILVDIQEEGAWKNSQKIRQFFSRNKRIRTSRCGDFKQALNLLQKNSETIKALNQHMISDIFSIQNLGQAFEKAKKPESKKVVVVHTGQSL